MSESKHLAQQRWLKQMGLYFMTIDRLCTLHSGQTSIEVFHMVASLCIEKKHQLSMPAAVKELWSMTQVATLITELWSLSNCKMEQLVILNHGNQMWTKIPICIRRCIYLVQEGSDKHCDVDGNKVAKRPSCQLGHPQFETGLGWWTATPTQTSWVGGIILSLHSCPKDNR